MKVIKINKDIFLIRHWGKWQYWLSDQAIYGDWQIMAEAYFYEPAVKEQDK